jgi:prophage regulatory protein
MANQANHHMASSMDVVSSFGINIFDPENGARLRQATMERLPAVTQQVGKKKSALYEDIGQGLFTPPVAIGTRARAWPDYEVQAINAARIAGMSDDEIRKLVAKLVEARKSARVEVL